MTNDLTTTGNPRLSLIESMAAGGAACSTTTQPASSSAERTAVAIVCHAPSTN